MGWLYKPEWDGYIGHVNTATITEAKNGLSALIDRVRSGESILILDRGVPVDRLQTGDGHTAVEDEDALAAPDPIDERAEPVLRLGDRGSVHMANVAIPLWLVKPSHSWGRSWLAGDPGAVIGRRYHAARRDGVYNALGPAEKTYMRVSGQPDGKDAPLTPRAPNDRRELPQSVAGPSHPSTRSVPGRL